VLALRNRDADVNESLDKRRYALEDANWNTTAVVNTSGTVLGPNWNFRIKDENHLF
jgi:hypothetical protein